jgi:uncharacterized protein (TIGR03437 family)
MDQITVQAPFELAPVDGIPVIVRTGVGTDSVREFTADSVPILPAAPGIFEYAPAGDLIAVAVRSDGSYVSPSNPARKGETIWLFATGLGPILPSVETNQPGVPGQVPFFRPVVNVGGMGAGGVTASYAENLIGIFVVSFMVPAEAPSGAGVELTLSMAEGDRMFTGKPSRLPVE